jgi:outer membrane biosynthesis protein TonB
MTTDEKNQTGINEKDVDLFKDLLDDFDDDEDEEDDEGKKSDGEKPPAETDEEKKKREEEEQKKKQEEEQRRKNKDAEEARKRREREAKEAAEKEKKSAQVKQLGQQMLDCTKKYPNLVIAELDKDENFKKFIDGKLLGKKTFTELYEDYVEMRRSFSEKSSEEVRQQYEKKELPSSGAPFSSGSPQNAQYYSMDELNKLAEKIPFMNDEEYAKVADKFEKSLEFYKKNKK